MSRVLSVLCLVFATLSSAAFAAAYPVDRGPPYTSEQFLELSATRVPVEMRKTLPEWWARAPEYLRKRLLASPSDRWWPIILCNYFGFKPEGMGVGGADKCEREAYQGTQRGKSFWTEDGRWIGPSEECKKRDKRTQYGELICD